MTWVYDEEAEADPRADEAVIDARLFDIASTEAAAPAAADGAGPTAMEEAEDEYERLLGRSDA